MYVNLHIVPHEEVLSIARTHQGDPGYYCEGYAIWDGLGKCDIYVVPIEFYG